MCVCVCVIGPSLMGFFCSPFFSHPRPPDTTPHAQQIISFLMNLHIMPRPVYFTRHGESMFNVHGLIGGDAALSPKGAYGLV